MTQAMEEGGAQPQRELPIVVLVVGMAGSGKTTLVHRLCSDASADGTPIYAINLDPAVSHVLILPLLVVYYVGPCVRAQIEFGVNIDIRDTIQYAKIMSDYNLGPNGAILTCLNLFATKFNEVVAFLERKSDVIRYVFVDTPGQIEAFTWSASGQLMTEALASTFPTVVVSTSPQTFMANMTYACSIMCRFQLPFVLALNKIDMHDAAFLRRWMTDGEAYARALRSTPGYSTELCRRLCDVLEEFYNCMTCCCVSAVTGSGAGELFSALAAGRKQYQEEFLPFLQQRQAEKVPLHLSCLFAFATARQERREQRAREEGADAGPEEFLDEDEDVSPDEDDDGPVCSEQERADLQELMWRIAAEAESSAGASAGGVGAQASSGTTMDDQTSAMMMGGGAAPKKAR